VARPLAGCIEMSQAPQPVHFSWSILIMLRFMVLFPYGVLFYPKGNITAGRIKCLDLSQII
jgi:hypothetical protein